MKPIITVYSPGTAEPSKKLEGYISAAFWIGVDHSEGDVGSVKIRQSVESYDTEVAELLELSSLMVQRQINFSVEFFTEPTPQHPASEVPVEMKYSTQEAPGETKGATDADYEAELSRIRDEYTRGAVTKKQYDARRSALLKRWKETVEGTLRK